MVESDIAVIAVKNTCHGRHRDAGRSEMKEQKALKRAGRMDAVFPQQRTSGRHYAAWEAKVNQPLPRFLGRERESDRHVGQYTNPSWPLKGAIET